MTQRRYMMATTAIHKLGDISRDEPDLCSIYDEDDTTFIGMWVTGFGFFDVRFPKETTRELTPDERDRFKRQHIALNGMDIGPALVEQ
jgi:hypothetical protein